MDIGQLDNGDRRNLYAEDADNVFVVEICAEEALDLSKEYRIDALAHAWGEIVLNGRKIAYLVIKVS